MEEAVAVTQPLFCLNRPARAGNTWECSSAPVPRAPPRESHPNGPAGKAMGSAGPVAQLL